MIMITAIGRNTFSNEVPLLYSILILSFVAMARIRAAHLSPSELTVTPHVSRAPAGSCSTVIGGGL